MDTDQTGDQGDNLRQQVRNFDELLEEQQISLRDLLASPLSTKDEDDDLADELDNLVRSEELLRQELKKLPGKTSSVTGPSNHGSVGPMHSHSHPQTSQSPNNNLRGLERSDHFHRHEEHGIVFYRDNWDDELFRGHSESDSNAADAFELKTTRDFLSHPHENDLENIGEMGWKLSDCVPGPVKDSSDKSKTELDMMLASDLAALSAIEEEDDQIEKTQKLLQTSSSLDNAAKLSASAGTSQSNMGMTVTPQKEINELHENDASPFSTTYATQTPPPTKAYFMSITPQSTNAPTPTRAPSPLKNTVAKLRFGKSASLSREQNSPGPAPAMKRPWFARNPSPAASSKTGEPSVLSQTKTPPAKSSLQWSEREDCGRSAERIPVTSESAATSTPTLVSILQNTVAFNPLEEHHEQVLGCLMLSPENIVFESSSDDDTYDNSIKHARKNLDKALEGEVPVGGSSSLASGGIPGRNERPPLSSGYPFHVRKPSLGDREVPQRWSPASSSAESKAASPSERNPDDPETDYALATPEELYPEFDFYAPKSEGLGASSSTNTEETRSENASCSSPLPSSSDSLSYESAIQALPASASFGSLLGNELRSNGTRSIASAEEILTKGSSSASQSFVTAIDDIPFSSNVSMKTISSGDASHITYETARDQEEENSSLVIGQINSVVSLDYELSNVEKGVAAVEAVNVPSKQMETYRNSDSDSETSQAQAYNEHFVSCQQMVKKIFVSPISVVVALVVIIAAIGLSIRLIIESTANEDSAMMVSGGNLTAPSFSPSRNELSPMPVFRTQQPMTSDELNVPTLVPTISPSRYNPTLVPASDSTATPVSTMIPGSPTIYPSVFPTKLFNGPSTLSLTTPTPLGEATSPSQSPMSAVPFGNLTDLMTFLSSVSFDSGAALRNTSTPQYAAYQWLSGNELLPTYSNSRLIQRYALATFYFSTDGDGWSQKTGWLSDGYECKWYLRSSIGSCDRLGRIVSLNLDYNEIGGTLPPELTLLSHLKLINLGGGPNRQLSGSIPTEIGKLQELQKLFLRVNQLTGTIPTQIGKLSNVEELHLKGNSLWGSIPTEISNMRKARIIDLSANMLVSNIPEGVGNLTGLQSLFLDNNTLEGTPPSEIGSLVSLQTLSLAGNRFTGIPVQITSLVNLTTLHMDRNKISGSLTSAIHQLSKLRFLTLSENRFNSTVPSTLGLLRDLNELDISLNHFTGTIPSEIGEISSRLRVLRLNGNRLIGSIPEKFSRLDRVNTLSLHDNFLDGAVPYTVCRVFESIVPSFSVDCKEVDCPCCNFCCDEENGCTCLYKGTDEEWRCN